MRGEELQRYRISTHNAEATFYPEASLGEITYQHRLKSTVAVEKSTDPDRLTLVPPSKRGLLGGDDSTAIVGNAGVC
jgi:hypothetical protein